MGKYKLLSKVLVKVFSAPSSTSGVERNHTTGKSVMYQLRRRLNDFSLQKQVNVAFNGNRLKRFLPTTGGAGFEKGLSSLCDGSADRQTTMLEFNPNNSSLDMSELDDEIVCLKTSLLDITDKKYLTT